MKIDKDIIDKQEKKYSAIETLLWRIERDLHDIERHQGRSLAFRNLKNALQIFENQVDADYRRFTTRINANTLSADNKLLQQSLNRERKLREELEAKVKEASESSGLFISYVRDKLGL